MLLARQHPSDMTEGRVGWRALIVLLAIVAMLAAIVFAAPRADAKTDHCVDHKTQVKIDAGDSPATVDVPDTSGGTISVIVTITGTDIQIEAADPSVDLTDAQWCIKSSTNTNDGTGATGSSTSMNKKGIVQDVSYVVVYSVTSGPPPQACDSSTTSGGPGVTVTTHELGESGPTMFDFDYEPYNVPDQFEVLYESVVIYDTGVIGGGSAGDTETITLPSGTSTQVTVRVTGPLGTAWFYKVNCPAAD
jgi:hypothetical protein